MEAYSRTDDRKVRVGIEAADFSCEGLVHLPGMRLSDVMNEKNDFLVVVNAVVTRKKSGKLHRTEYATLLVRKGEIEFVVPLDEAADRHHIYEGTI